MTPDSNKARIYDSQNAPFFSSLTESLALGLLCDLEQAKQAEAAQHRDAQGRHDIHPHQQHLQDADGHHEAVKAIEERHKVGRKSQSIHLQEHLDGKQRQQHLVGRLCDPKTGSENPRRGAIDSYVTIATNELHSNGRANPNKLTKTASKYQTTITTARLPKAKQKKGL